MRTYHCVLRYSLFGEMRWIELVWVGRDAVGPGQLRRRLRGSRLRVTVGRPGGCATERGDQHWSRSAVPEGPRQSLRTDHTPVTVYRQGQAYSFRVEERVGGETQCTLLARACSHP